MKIIRTMQEAREEAIARVDENADPEWKEEAYWAFCELAKRGREFTTDDVWELLEERGVPAPHEPRAMGPVTRRVKREGIVEEVRVGTSRLVRGHGRRVAVYLPLPR